MAELRALESEKDFQRDVIKAAELNGWLVFHAHDSRKEVRRQGVSYFVGDKQARGFPDLVLCHPHRGLLFAELKAESGRMEVAQEIWLQVLRLAGARVKVWTPSMWAEVQAELTR